MERLTAKKVRIVDIVNGKFVAGDQEKRIPSYLITPYGEKISRVNIIGTITEKFLSEDGSYLSFVLDDGTEAIRVKAFKEKASLANKFEIGDLVLIIGRIRNFNGENYVNLEIIRKVEDPNEEVHRKAEIVEILREKQKIAKELKELSEKLEFENVLNYAKQRYGIDEESLKYLLSFSVGKEDYKKKIVEILENLDEGEGVEIGKIFEVLDLPENQIEEIIEELWNEGIIFEPLPGKFKIIKK
ncbi:MAG: hypothetical protein B6U78_00095 [Candidatus Aenigmarchaeota archaeon ex4484_224]|nr:MAG: hypothetical protein B6U78_00095 [Candidatus Aenigmarchaeota archaeon ex4484_224]